ncbi:MAG: small multi-drug export protein [Candidatus Omnitrophota bacterium]
MLQEKIFNFLYSFGWDTRVLITFLGTLPVTELRASIPIGILVLKENVKFVVFYSILGNLIPIAPIYFLLDPISKKLSKTPIMKRFFDWLFARAKKRAGLIEKYEAIGLALFVGIPLPGTGVWTGCLIASLLRMRFLPTFIAATIGVFIAATIVTLLTLLGKLAF